MSNPLQQPGKLRVLLAELGLTLLVCLSTSAVALGASPGLGSLDSSYGNDAPDALISSFGGRAFDPGGIAALPDGASLVADADAVGLARLTGDQSQNVGAPDPGFGLRGIASGPVAGESDAVAVTPGGSYLVAGSGNGQLIVAEFNSDGSLDTSFAAGSANPGIFAYGGGGGPQAVSASAARGLVVGPDGVIWVVGSATIASSGQSELLLGRLSSDGSGFETFSDQADAQATEGSGVAVGPNETVYVAGTENPGTTHAKAVLARVTRSGIPAKLELDTSFDASGPTPGSVTTTLSATTAQAAAVAAAPDGSVLIGGQAITGSATSAVVARFTATGGLDTSFGAHGIAILPVTPSGDPMSFVRAIALEPNGAPIVAGDAQRSATPYATFVAELTTRGALDPNFRAGTQDPGVAFADALGGFNTVTVTGLAIDGQDRFLLGAEQSSTGSSPPPDAGTVQRYFGYGVPTASFAAPAAAVVGRAASFDASASTDPIGPIADYAWDFDGSGTFATDGGTAPTIAHAFTSSGTVTVSLRVSNPVGNTATASHVVQVLSASGSTSAAALTASPSSLSFSAYINEFDQFEQDSGPQPVRITNSGSAPLHISAVRIINAEGGFAITGKCIEILQGNGTYGGSCDSDLPADTCTGATLLPGNACAVELAYTDGGVYPSASGALEIDSNAPSSPDLVALSATAKIISSAGGTGNLRCPGVIGDGGVVGTGGDALALAGCWTDLSGAQTPQAGDDWGAYGPVTIDQDITLQPTQPTDELLVTPGPNRQNAISAVPSSAAYEVLVVPPGGNVPTQPVGTVDLGANPFVCRSNGPVVKVAAGASPYGFCGDPNTGLPDLLQFSPSRPPDTIHGLAITGGDIAFDVCGTATDAYATLPHLFSINGTKGSPPPTATFEFTGGPGSSSGACGPPPPGSGVGGPPNPLTCPGEKTPTPNCNGQVIMNTPYPKERNLGRPHPDDDQSGPCPSDEVNYTDTVPGAFVGAMNFGSPYLCYDPATDVWTAGGHISVLSASIDTGPPPLYGIGFKSDGTFDHGGIQDVTFSPIPLQIFGPVGLADFGGAYAVNPTRLGAHATLVAGPITITGGGFAVWANHSYPYTYDPNSPYSIPGVKTLQTDTRKDPLTDFAAGVGGTVGIMVPPFGTLQLASAYVFYAAPSYFEFGGNIGINSDGTPDCPDSGASWCIGGGVLGAFDTGNKEYDIAGHIDACANFPVIGDQCVGLQGVVSSQGLGVCGELGPITGGFTLSWGQGPNFFGGIGQSCDDGLGPITVAVQRSKSLDPRIAHVAAASGAVSLNLAGHPPSTSVYVYGAGAPPAVSLTGPKGQTVTEPAGGKGIVAHGVVIWPEPKLDETVILISHPAAGRWTVTPQAGSTAISKLAYANVLPAPSITATVSGHGSTRTLSYRIRARAGQLVTFAERAGRVFHVLGKTSHTDGTLRFTPALGPGGERQIVALISLSDKPTPTLVAGRYTAPPPPTAGRPGRVRLSRTGIRLNVSWGAAANATGYLVQTSLSDGQRATYTEPARARTITLPAIGPSTDGTIQVSANGPMGNLGPAARVTLTPATGPGRVTGLKSARHGNAELVSWQATRGAKLYILRLTSGRVAFAPKYLAVNRFVSTTTLPDLRQGTVATITVAAVDANGQQGAASSLRYRGPHKGGASVATATTGRELM